MVSLAFPQLSSGAMAQYPIRKRRLFQCPLNAFADGGIVSSAINPNSQLTWDLSYIDLTADDQQSLQRHVTACGGPLRPFIFIDPTDNMLSGSTALDSGVWTADPLLSVTPGATDPFGGTTAYTLVNSSQVDQQVGQQINAPAYFQYCFSVYASAPSVSDFRSSISAASADTKTVSVGVNWSRVVHSARLPDSQTGFRLSLIVPPAQTVVVWGPQLEPQLSPSSYRATVSAGGVYQNAHLLGNSLTFESSAPGLFSTLLSIETT